MTTMGQAVENTRRRLLAGTTEQLNQLAEAIDDETQTIPLLQELGPIQQGAILNVDYELMFVLESGTGSANSQSATVIRGYAGSTAAAANENDLVLISPKWSRLDILTEINNELNGLSAEGLFQAKSVDLTYNSVIEGYDLPLVDAEIDSLLEVRYQTAGPQKDWPTIDPSSCWLQRFADSADFPDSMALQIRRGGQSGFDIRVVYKAPFTTTTSPTDDLTTVCGLPGSAADIPEIGASIRLTYAREVARNASFTTQTGVSKSQDEPAAALVNAAKGWESLYQNRIQREVDRLMMRWPTRHQFL